MVISIGSDVCPHCQWEYKFVYSHLGKQFGVLSTKITNVQILLTQKFHFLESDPRKPLTYRRRHFIRESTTVLFTIEKDTVNVLIEVSSRVAKQMMGYLCSQLINLKHWETYILFVDMGPSLRHPDGWNCRETQTVISLFKSTKYL